MNQNPPANPIQRHPHRVRLDPSGAHDFDIPAGVENWTDNPLFSLASGDFALRPNRVVSSVIFHNTQGLWPQTIIQGADVNGQRAENVIAIWRREQRAASAPVVIDTDATMVQAHYLIPCVAFHARSANGRSIGVELVMKSPSTLFTASMDTGANLVHGLIQCNHPQVQLLNPPTNPGELPWLEIRTSYPTDGTRPAAVPVEQRGVFGHRDVRPMDRGRGDPGDAVMLRVAQRLEELSGSGGLVYRVVRT